ncbi:MAG: C40 family peptidase [Candidatus Kapabacteria bacterium]|nr:C40 family peptidase [Candidatus Kapabacteria bacterium]MCS7169031.1 C40 family peptidase [Candidatus Kapabacteria bacterium]MDW7997373.1 C40 family peptidase [Bacteroidota bacterium]MDW8224422.1 C40 family peptidase [Bacteroidota bacterium]
MKALTHVLCAAVAFVAVDVWKVPAAFAVQQLKKATQWVSKAKKKKSVRRNIVPQEYRRQQALEFVRTQSQTLWGMFSGVYDSPLAPGQEISLDRSGVGEELLEGEDPDEVAREDDVPVDIETFRQLWMAYMEGEPSAEQTASGLRKSQIVAFVLDWLGTPYRFGGTSTQGIDCSAFIRRLFAEVAGVWLPRTAAAQYSFGIPVQRGELQFGDLLFFHTRRHAYVSHVGIYLGDDLFAHSSSRYGVTVSSLRSTYYSKRFIGARRLTEQTLLQLSTAQETQPEAVVRSN